MSKKNKNGEEKTRAIQPVSFNLLDPEEKEAYDYARQENPLTGEPQNFSKLVRRLLLEEKRRKEQGYNNNNSNNSSGLTIIDVPNDDDETYSIEVKEAMNSFL